MGHTAVPKKQDLMQPKSNYKKRYLHTSFKAYIIFEKA